MGFFMSKELARPVYKPLTSCLKRNKANLLLLGHHSNLFKFPSQELTKK